MSLKNLITYTQDLMGVEGLVVVGGRAVKAKVHDGRGASADLRRRPEPVISRQT